MLFSSIDLRMRENVVSGRVELASVSTVWCKGAVVGGKTCEGNQCQDIPSDLSMRGDHNSDMLLR